MARRKRKDPLTSAPTRLLYRTYDQLKRRGRVLGSGDVYLDPSLPSKSFMRSILGEELRMRGWHDDSDLYGTTRGNYPGPMTELRDTQQRECAYLRRMHRTEVQRAARACSQAPNRRKGWKRNPQACKDAREGLRFTRGRLKANGCRMPGKRGSDTW